MADEVGGDTHLQIGQREGLRRRQTANIEQPVAEPRENPRHQLHVAHTVLEADQVGTALAQPGQRGLGQLCVVAVVDDDAEPRGPQTASTWAASPACSELMR